MTPSLALERARFPLAKDFAYLDHASRGPLSPPAVEMIGRITEEMVHLHPDLQTRMPGDFEAAREGIGALIGASPRSVAFCLNVSAGLSQVAGALPLAEGDRILCARGEFPANIYPWLNLKRRGLNVDFIEPGPEGITPDLVARGLTSKTRVAALSWVGFSDGVRIDLAGIGAVCRERDVFFVTDTMQGLGALEPDLSGVDIAVNGGGKWLLSPQAGGFIYVRPELIERLNPDHVGWLSMEGLADCKDFGSLLDYRFALCRDARRLETGSNSLISQLPLGASCRYLAELGPARIERRIRYLAARLREGLARKGLETAGPAEENRRSGIVAFAVEDAKKTVKRLFEAGVIVSAREGRIRTGIHFYNDETDVDRLLSALP